MKLLFENWRQFLTEAELRCVPLDEWAGPPSGIRIYSHSTGRITPSNFNEVVEDGFRISRSGVGTLSITFLEENPSGIKESLRKRVSGEHYNLGTRVVLAGANPELQKDRGVFDDVLAAAQAGEADPLGVQLIKNVRLFEEYPEGHRWRKNSWSMPGRFLLGLYDGDNDSICLNPSFDASTGTEYGERLHNNFLEYQKIEKSHMAHIQQAPAPAAPVADVPGEDIDDDVF